MSSLSDRPDLNQLRTQAKEFKRAVEAGEQAAVDRVLASHPKCMSPTNREIAVRHSQTRARRWSSRPRNTGTKSQVDSRG